MSDSAADTDSGTLSETRAEAAPDNEATTLLLENDLLQRELEQVRQNLAEATRESELAKDLARRTQADLTNVRRRADNERREYRARALEAVCLSFLPVLDDLERAAAEGERAAAAEEAAGGRTPDSGADPAAGVKALSEGVALVLRRFRDTLTSHGIEEIEAEGTPFDPRLHEALLRSPAAPGERDEQVTRVFERGFRRGSRVIRHAKVQVADGSAAGVPAAEEDPRGDPTNGAASGQEDTDPAAGG